MITKPVASVFAAAALASTPAAMAQLPGDPAAGEPGTAAPAATFTDAQIASYARAMAEVESINADTTMDADARQTEMRSAIETAGLDVTTFNTILRQSQTDTELRARIDQERATQQSAP